MKALSEARVASWKRDGFLFPFDFLNQHELRACLEGLARYEHWLGAPVNVAKDLKWRTMLHIILPWVTRLATDPRVLDPVEDLLGPDILIYTSTFFIKDPNTPSIAAWHQDSTYYGLEPAEEITLWVALSEANCAAGCMDVVSWNGTPRQMRHEAHVVEHSVNRAGQIITEPLDKTDVISMELKPGQFSMHHGLCPHRSGPNTSGHRRIGLGLNFIPATVRPTGAIRQAAMLARGEDKWGYFHRVPPPKTELDDDAIAAHEDAVTRYRETYREQEALHARLSA